MTTRYTDEKDYYIPQIAGGYTGFYNMENWKFPSHLDRCIQNNKQRPTCACVTSHFA